MAGERINNPATKWRTKCNGFALLFWEQEERFDSDVFHQPLQDAASVHGVVILSSMVLGITQNCPLGYARCSWCGSVRFRLTGSVRLHLTRRQRGSIPQSCEAVKS